MRRWTTHRRGRVVANHLALWENERVGFKKLSTVIELNGRNVEVDIEAHDELNGTHDRFLVTARARTNIIHVDRSEIYSWSLGTYSRRTRMLADRLERAIQQGKVFPNVSIVTDVAGMTYVSATSCVMGRYLNRDLKRLGF